LNYQTARNLIEKLKKKVQLFKKKTYSIGLKKKEKNQANLDELRKLSLV
jgi:molybdopterin synthase catalytic subunit